MKNSIVFFPYMWSKSASPSEKQITIMAIFIFR